jgi:hypothetical protein
VSAGGCYKLLIPLRFERTSANRNRFGWREPSEVDYRACINRQMVLLRKGACEIKLWVVKAGQDAHA